MMHAQICFNLACNFWAHLQLLYFQKSKLLQLLHPSNHSGWTQGAGLSVSLFTYTCIDICKYMHLIYTFDCVCVCVLATLLGIFILSFCFYVFSCSTQPKSSESIRIIVSIAHLILNSNIIFMYADRVAIATSDIKVV